MNWTRWLDTVLVLPTVIFMALWGLTVYVTLLPFVAVVGLCRPKSKHEAVSQWFVARINAALGERKT